MCFNVIKFVNSFNFLYILKIMVTNKLDFILTGSLFALSVAFKPIRFFVISYNFGTNFYLLSGSVKTFIKMSHALPESLPHFPIH